mgnify:CR=1 FL=1
MYIPIDPYGAEVNRLGVDLVRLPYTVKDDFLVLDDYLLEKSGLLSKRNFEYKNWEGDFEVVMQKIISLYSSSIRKYALGIVKGKRWKGGFFPKWF